MGVSASTRPPAAMRSAADPNHTPGHHASEAAELSQPGCAGGQRRVNPLAPPEPRKPRRKRVPVWGSLAVLGRVTHEASLEATAAAQQAAAAAYGGQRVPGQHWGGGAA